MKNQQRFILTNFRIYTTNNYCHLMCVTVIVIFNNFFSIVGNGEYPLNFLTNSKMYYTTLMTNIWVTKTQGVLLIFYAPISISVSPTSLSWPIASPAQSSLGFNSKSSFASSSLWASKQIQGGIFLFDSTWYFLFSYLIETLYYCCRWGILTSIMRLNLLKILCDPLKIN